MQSRSYLAVLPGLFTGEESPAKAVKASAPNADLNGDGTVDIADLQYYANSLELVKDGADTAAALTSRVYDDAVAIKAGAETRVASGSLDKLLSNEGSLTLETEVRRCDQRGQSGGSRDCPSEQGAGRGRSCANGRADRHYHR